MTPAIRITGLTKSYGDLEVLRGVDLDVAPGSIFALLGTNGAGKTTLPIRHAGQARGAEEREGARVMMSV